MQAGPGPALSLAPGTTSNRAWCGRSKDTWVRSQHRDAEIVMKRRSIAGTGQCHGGELSKRATRKASVLDRTLAGRTAKMLHLDVGDSAREGEVLAGDAERGVARV